MSDLIGVVGSSGEGKSTAIHKNEDLNISGLNPKETVIINVAGKPLPFRGWKKFYKPFEGKTGNYLSSSDARTIIKAFEFIDKNRPEIKHIVLDDAQYIMGFRFMEKALEKGFDKFNILGKEYFDILNAGRLLRENLKVYILTHSDEIHKDFETTRKMKTLGRMLDQNITLEGLFTVLVYTHSEWDDKENVGHYSFITNRTSDYPAKSPVGMFDSIQIPNDLGYIAQKVDEYNGE